MKQHAQTRSASSEVYTFHVESLSHEGRGIAHYDVQRGHPAHKHGKKVFIQFALPNEQVKAKITHQVKRLEEADTLELLSEPSEHRIQPMCPHFQHCGGCNLQHMHPDEQIHFKQQVLASHLQHFAGIEPEVWLEPIRSQRSDYRRRARIGVRYIPKKQQLVMGFRERQSNRLIDIQHCPVLDQKLDQSLPDLKKLLQSLKGKADIGHIELAMGDDEVALLLRHTKALIQPDVQKLLDFAQKNHWQLYLQPEGTDSIHRVDVKQPMRLHYRLEAFDVDFAFAPSDFTQVNATVNAQMVELACELLKLQQGERVLDLFCGLGNFSLPLARCVGQSGQVVAVEGSDDMVQRGTENALHNGLMQLSFYSHDLTKDFSQQTWAKQGFDALLIDPPRSGAEQVMHYISNFNAKRIVYVSCNPATLARDAAILIQQGYQLKKAGVMDMFTHTGHVESITLFEKIELMNDENE